MHSFKRFVYMVASRKIHFSFIVGVVVVADIDVVCLFGKLRYRTVRVSAYVYIIHFSIYPKRENH